MNPWVLLICSIVMLGTGFAWDSDSVIGGSMILSSMGLSIFVNQIFKDKKGKEK